MDDSKRKAMDNFGSGVQGMVVAHRELKLPNASVRVAGSQGVGTAIEHVRATKAAKAAARKRQKASRRGNR